MLSFSTQNSFYKNTGLALFFLQLAAFVYGLPPFRIGLWMQTEPVMLAVLLVTALSCLWLCLGIVYRWLVINHTSPVVIVIILWVGWQLLCLPFADSYWRAWFGPPETGEGIAWHLSLLVMVVHAYSLWQVKKYRHMLLIAATCCLSVMCLLHWFYPNPVDGQFDPESWAPVQWPAYLAFIAGYLWIASATDQVFRREGWYCGMIVLVYAVLFLSANKSAILLFSPAILLSTLVLGLKRYPSARRFFYPVMKWRVLAAITCFLPLLFVLFSQQVSGFIDHQSDDLGLTAATLSDADGSLGSRVILNQVALATMENEPKRWFYGAGWGRFTDDLYKYALVEGVYVYKDGIRDPSSFLVDAGAFHSHSQPLEALLSLGITGFLLWFAVPLTVIFLLPERYFWHVVPMMVAITMLGYFWFQILQCLPYQVLGLCAVARACRKSQLKSPLPTVAAVVAGFLLFLCVILFWSGIKQASALVDDECLRDALRGVQYDDYHGECMQRDILRGGERFVAMTGFFNVLTINKSSGGATPDKIVEWYSHILAYASQAATQPSTGARMAFQNLWMHYILLFVLTEDQSFESLIKEKARVLREPVFALLEKAPLRDDAAVPFLQDLSKYIGPGKEVQVRVLREMLEISPSHRGALWTLGKLLLQDDKTKIEGERFLSRALELGVDSVFPAAP